MKAMVIESFGKSEQLKLADIPTPQPKDNEVLIAISYTGVNPVDWKIREGMYKSNMPHEFPLIPGWEASGSVAAAGKNVHNFKVGDKVFAYCRKPVIKEGTYAEFIAFDAAHVAKMPSNLSFAEAAAIPLAALTAWQSIHDFANIQKEQRILIHAGAGGVGSFAIQFAKNAGAVVYTTCSAANFDYVKKLGADYAIDYTKEDFAKKIDQKLDSVFDTVGGKTLRASVELLKPNGCLVSIIEQISPEITQNKPLRCGHVFVRPDGEQLGAIAKLIEQGKIQLPAIEEMELKEAADAQEKSKQGHIRGKIVLKVGDID